MANALSVIIGGVIAGFFAGTYFAMTYLASRVKPPLTVARAHRELPHSWTAKARRGGVPCMLGSKDEIGLRTADAPIRL